MRALDDPEKLARAADIVRAALARKHGVPNPARASMTVESPVTTGQRREARPPRRVPSLKKIVAYWAEKDVFDFDPEQPRCFACRGIAPEWSGAYFDRAHLVDRVYDGLDLESNIIPLCTECHKYQPAFKAGCGQDAIEWVKAGGWIETVRRVIEQERNTEADR